MNTHLLSLLILLPVAGALLVALTRRGSESLQKTIGLAVSGAAFALSLLLVTGFQDVAGPQFAEQRPWIPAWGISYHVGVDGVSLPLVMMVAILMPLVGIGMINRDKKGLWLNLLLVQPLGIRGVSTATLVGFALSTALLYAWAQKVHPIPFRGLRASALFLAGVGTLLAGVLGGRAVAAAWGAPASLGLRLVLLCGYAGLAAFLARRMEPPWDGPLVSSGDATVPVVLPEEHA